MYTNHVTIAGILERLLRHPLLRDLSYADASSYAVECLNNIGSLSFLTKKGTFIDIASYKGVLPVDFVSLNSSIDGIRRVYNDDGEFRYTPMYKATDQFHVNYSDSRRYFTSNDERNTFHVSGNIITTGFEEGTVEITYYGLATTDSGEILIPRHPFVIKAIEEYIKQEYFRILFDLGKVRLETYTKAEQEYSFAIGKASNAGKALSIADRENLSNMLTRMISSDNDYNHGFADLYTPPKQQTSSNSTQVPTTGVTISNGTLNLEDTAS